MVTRNQRRRRRQPTIITTLMCAALALLLAGCGKATGGNANSPSGGYNLICIMCHKICLGCDDTTESYGNTDSRHTVDSTQNQTRTLERKL